MDALNTGTYIFNYSVCKNTKKAPVATEEADRLIIQLVTGKIARTTIPSTYYIDCVSYPFPHTTKSSPQLMLQVSEHIYLCSILKEKN